MDELKNKIKELVPDAKEPLGLSDVLRAIGSMLIVVDACGNFYRLKMSLADMLPSFDKKAGTVRWDLALDYDNQTQEVKDFIATLLTP